MLPAFSRMKTSITGKTRVKEYFFNHKSLQIYD